MLWEIEIRPAHGQVDREGLRILRESREIGARTITSVESARAFLIEGDPDRAAIERAAQGLLVDTVVEAYRINELPADSSTTSHESSLRLLTVLFKPGVTDNVGASTRRALSDLGLEVDAVATCRKYWFNASADEAELDTVASRVLANEAIEHIQRGPLERQTLTTGSSYDFEAVTVPIREMHDDELSALSRDGQLFLNTVEMKTIRTYFEEQDRDPTDAELETIAQTWSEHCSHKTLAGRMHYVETTADGRTSERYFDNMLGETIFAATVAIRERLGDADWCVSVFEDNAGIVRFDERQNVCFKVETHNHPSALEPYGGANTGIGGVIRDPLGTGLGARPICNTDVFCFAPLNTQYESLPPGVLHPQAVARGVVSGVRDYGNRMGIPTVNGAVFFDERYLGNPLVYCGNAAVIPVEKSEKHLEPGDLVVTVGGRTGRDGIHGATFSSAELTEQSDQLSGGAVQIGNAITEKMVVDVILQARDRGLFSAITDCGAGGFSSAIGEMGENTGAEVWLDKAPLKYSGLSYTEIWISEAQERMILAVPPGNRDEFVSICSAEGVEATVIGRFTETGRLVLKYHDQQVADLSMKFLHGGRPPVVREAVYDVPAPLPLGLPQRPDYNDELLRILGSPNVASREWIIRQYDHEVQGGSVVKPLVGVNGDGPSDAAVVRPDLESCRGLVIANGMNPRFGEFDPYWMAASAIDEAIRNCVACGADPARTAILDNFCWGNTDQPETLGSLVRAAIACHDMAVALGTPFISGKDSLNNEFSYMDSEGQRQTVAIPGSLLISALGQIDDVNHAVTMDLKQSGNLLFLLGNTMRELGGSHFALVNGLTGGNVPRVNVKLARRIFAAVHTAISSGLVRSCHDLSEGGLAVAVAEMAFAGGLGVDLDLASLTANGGTEPDVVMLFSESNTRFVIEVEPDNALALIQVFEQLPLVRAGYVTNEDRVVVRGKSGDVVIDATTHELRQAWQTPLAWE